MAYFTAGIFTPQLTNYIRVIRGIYSYYYIFRQSRLVAFGDNDQPTWHNILNIGRLLFALLLTETGGCAEEHH